MLAVTPYQQKGDLLHNYLRPNPLSLSTSLLTNQIPITSNQQRKDLLHNNLGFKYHNLSIKDYISVLPHSYTK